MMIKNNTHAFTLLFAFVLLVFGACAPSTTSVEGGASTSACSEPQEMAFRNAVNLPPPGWQGPVFELSHDYPTEYPGDCDECPWLSVDVDFSVDFDAPPPAWTDGWDQYLNTIKEYVRQGQDPQLSNEAGWDTTVEGETRWFHVPWMAYDPTVGREFIHGMTNERTAHLSDFLGAPGRHGLHALPGVDSGDGPGFETWAFGVYNPWGGWSVGQAIPKSTGVPVSAEDQGMAVAAGLPFPQGTAVAKLLFTTATPAIVPYLNGSPQWQADRHVLENGAYQCRREPQPVYLVQMDVAVVDSRSPTRWVFGTFAYNGTIDAQSPWDRLSPVGVQWGSDPWTFPAVPRSESIPARQSVLAPIDIYEHDGCQDRLAGPVDNKLSSCLSCHGGAYAPPVGDTLSYGSNVPIIFGFDGQCDNFSSDNVNYFQNRPYPIGYNGGQFPSNLSLDTSLQLQVAFAQYGQCNTNGKPASCTLSQ